VQRNKPVMAEMIFCPIEELKMETFAINFSL